VESMNTTRIESQPFGAVAGLTVGNNATTDTQTKVVL